MVTLSEAEMRLANMIWETPGISASALSALCEEKYGWKRTTTYTLIRRMRDKGFLSPGSSLSMLVKKSDFYRTRTDAVIDGAFHGSLPLFISAFMKERSLTKEEADEIRKLIDEAENK